MPRYRCGGYASYTGHCGATDCETCYPGCRNCLVCGSLDTEESPCECLVCDDCGEKIADSEVHPDYGEEILCADCAK